MPPAVARLRPGDRYYPASGRYEKQNYASSPAGGRKIVVTRLEPGDCGGCPIEPVEIEWAGLCTQVFDRLRLTMPVSLKIEHVMSSSEASIIQ